MSGGDRQQYLIGLPVRTGIFESAQRTARDGLAGYMLSHVVHSEGHSGSGAGPVGDWRALQVIGVDCRRMARPAEDR